MKWLAYILGLLFAVGSHPGSAAQAPASAAESRAKVSRATAAALARVVAPMDLMVPIELEQARKTILALPTMDQEAKQLEQDYPGLYAALWAAVEPEMRRQTEADYPSYWAVLEQLYLSRLTEPEALALMEFFKSPTGQKLMRSMYGSFDAVPLIADMAKTDSSTISAAQMQTATDAAKAKAVRQIGPEDEASLLKLVATIDLKKFQALGAETQKVTLDWVNKEDPEGEAKLARIMEETMGRYMDARPPKK